MRLKSLDLLYIFTILLTIVLFFSKFPLNEDSKWILHCAEEMIKGSTLYIDKIDVNPPLIFIYSTLAVYLSKITSISIINSYLLLVISVIIFSIYLCWGILKNVFIEDNNSKIRYYLYVISFILFISISYDFGEREHLFIIFIFPYVLMSMYRNDIFLSKPLIVSIAVFASLGFNLKPHFFLIFILIELLFLVYKKDIFSFIRIDFFIIVSSSFLYLLIIYVFFSEFFTFMIPFAIETYVDVFNMSFVNLFINPEIFTSIFVFIFYLIFAKNKFSLQNLTLLTTVFASLVIYLLQQKGWSYHKLPVFTFSILFLFYILFHDNYKKAIYSLVLTPFIMYTLYYSTILIHSSRFEKLHSLIKTFPQNASIHVVSTDLAKGQPLLNQEEQIWASRFPSFFMIVSMLQKNQKVIDYTFNSIYEDLIKYETDIIVFQKSEKGLGFYDYFIKENKRLDTFYKNYYKLTEKDNFIVLYKKDLK